MGGYVLHSPTRYESSLCNGQRPEAARRIPGMRPVVSTLNDQRQDPETARPKASSSSACPSVSASSGNQGAQHSCQHQNRPVEGRSEVHVEGSQTGQGGPPQNQPATPKCVRYPGMFSDSMPARRVTSGVCITASAIVSGSLEYIR